MQTAGGGVVMNAAESHGIPGIRGLSRPTMKSSGNPLGRALVRQ